MAQQIRNRSTVWRVIGAALVAIVLWAIVSLSGTFVWTMEVPLKVSLPSNLGLVQPIPRSLNLTVTTTGWELMKMIVTGRTESVLYPTRQLTQGRRVINISKRQLLESIRMNVSEARLVSVYPDSLSLVIGHLTRKRVPLRPQASIITREGFQVVGPLRVNPDTVELSGSYAALQEIDRWETRPIVVQDVHNPITKLVVVSDSLSGVVTVRPRIVTLTADVQEVAERLFTDIPIINRGTVRDTSLELVMQPQRISVLVRGGAHDLSRLHPHEISAYVDVLEGTDTIGIARPRVVPPQRVNVSVVRIDPPRIRYLWRRTVE